MTIEEFIDRALGVQFKVGGRDYAGWDCWGLVFCAYRDVFKAPIKSFAHEYNAINLPEINDLIGREKPEWITTEKPTVGDIGLFRVGRYFSHVALVVPDNRMLHCEKRTDTISERLDNMIWARRNVGYFQRA